MSELSNFKQTSFDIMSFSVFSKCITFDFFEQDACSSKSVIAFFLVFVILVMFEHWSLNSLSWFNVSKPSNKVGVDVPEYNVFDNVDVDGESAVKIVCIILYKNNFN